MDFGDPDWIFEVATNRRKEELKLKQFYAAPAGVAINSGDFGGGTRSNSTPAFDTLTLSMLPAPIR